MEKGQEEDSVPDLRSRLAKTWKFDRPRFWVILCDELKPYCMRWLFREFERSNLCEEDFEDCFTDAVEGLMRRESKQIDSPMNYVFTCARNAALDIINERKRIATHPLELLKGGEDWFEITEEIPSLPEAKWDPEALVDVAEVSLQDEVTPKTEQLSTIFNHLLGKLSKDRRWFVELLLEHGPSTPNAVFAEIMGKSETNVKSLKSRTLSSLRDLFFESAGEMGIDVKGLLAPEQESSLGNLEIPSDETDF